MLGVLDRTTTRVVSLLEAPGNPEIDTRGLVLGRVQSGKTANFTGVIAKAADCNYRFFIILSGIHFLALLFKQVKLSDNAVKWLSGVAAVFALATAVYTGFSSTRSCNAPCGHTAAQNVRPANKATTSGSTKNAVTASGTAYPRSQSPSATFCTEPMAHTQPFFQNPK